MRQLQALDAVQPCDACEWHPLGHLLALATYQTSTVAAEPLTAEEEEDGVMERPPTVSRQGAVRLFRWTEKDQLEEHQRLDGPAVLDLKWTSQPLQDGKYRLAVADAKAGVVIYSLNPETNKLEKEQRVILDEENQDGQVLCLSLEWSDRKQAQPSAPTLAVSLSSGSLAVLSLSSSSSWQISHHLPNAHANEAWVTSFSLSSPPGTVIWSGSDDLTLKAWDLRAPAPASWEMGKWEAGVTSLAPHPGEEYLWAVGSYDGILRLFDERYMPVRRKASLGELDVGGGAWRCKWHPLAASQGATKQEKWKGKLAVAAMHAGITIVDFPALSRALDGEAEGKVVKRYEQHGKDALGYGVDWHPSSGANGRELLASCSFYDCSLQAWEYGSDDDD